MPKGWVRKSELDRRRGLDLPIPTQVVSNEEFDPLPQTRRQREVERRIEALSADAAKRLGIDRRRFLRSSCGTAVAFAAMNGVFGRFFAVEPEEILDPAAATPSPYFVFDAQTHHVDALPKPDPLDQSFLELVTSFRRFGAMWNPDLKGREAKLSDLYRINYIKEVFLDSETHVAVLSGLPQWTAGSYPISPEEIVKTRGRVNELAASRRLVSHGVLSPELGTRNMESMRAQVEGLGIEAWKGYPGQPLGPDGSGWWLDDEKVAYPALDLSRKLGIRNVCLHKGLPAPGFSAEHCNPKDIFKPAIDFPDLNFLVYHAGLRGIGEMIPAVQSEFKDSAEVPWVTDLCEWKKKNPKVSNVYMELGATFGMTAITLPLLCAHILGMIIEAFGEDHVLWGTDSIWWGSPQWQIEAFKRFEMPESLMNRFSYKPLTTEVKAKILGLNAARVYGIDPKERIKPLPTDAIDRLRALNAEARLSTPSHTQYGWVRG